MCHISHLMCHMSCVTCNMSHVIFFFLLDKVLEGLISTGHTPYSSKEIMDSRIGSRIMDIRHFSNVYGFDNIKPSGSKGLFYPV